MKKTIKINESKLRRIVRECIKSTLNEEGGVCQYKIYQINPHDDNLRGKKFMDYDMIEKHFGGVDFNDYQLVYQGEIECQDNIDDVLEEIFRIFNIEHPSDYRGHSLSTGDIVEVNGTKYYCDSYGWKQL